MFDLTHMYTYWVWDVKIGHPNLFLIIFPIEVAILGKIPQSVTPKYDSVGNINYSSIFSHIIHYYPILSNLLIVNPPLSP
jgi:hypothetical protein